MKKKRLYRFLKYVVPGVGLVTCLYLACWEATATWGARDLCESIRSAEQARLPIEVLADGSRLATPIAVSTTTPCALVLKTNVSLGFRSEQRYYVWLFGSLNHLPRHDATGSFDTSKSFLVRDDFSWESYWDSSDAFRFRSPVPRLLLIGALGISFLVGWRVLPRLRRGHWRVRQSLRGLLIFIAVICGYCALWVLTNRIGIRYELGDAYQQRRLLNDSGVRGYAIAPFVICIESPAETYHSDAGDVRTGKLRRYSLWIPGNRNIALYPRYLKTLD